jgi:hypothetical protein
LTESVSSILVLSINNVFNDAFNPWKAYELLIFRISEPPYFAQFDTRSFVLGVVEAISPCIAEARAVKGEPHRLSI